MFIKYSVKIISVFLSLFIIISCACLTSAAPDGAEEAPQTARPSSPFDLDCASAVLMDAECGTILYNKNGDAALPPASVTKVMTLLLVMEAVDGGVMSLTDTLQVSEYAASMGGSQVYLEPGEQMTVEELIKCVVISSANDAAVTLAEAVGGSESAFVNMMNERARQLGMTSTNFENATGLDDTTVNHVTSAADIAVMSRELLSHETILKYSSIWTDTIRDGAFGLTNTNRLIRFYNGATGLKTGSTSKAKFCISATACRDGMHLIAVIMGAPTRDVRNEAAKTLLDWGFANFAVIRFEEAEQKSIRVIGGESPCCRCRSDAFAALIPKSDAKNFTTKIEMADQLASPVKEGDVVGKVVIEGPSGKIGELDIKAAESVDKMSFGTLFRKMLGIFSMS